MKSILLIGVVAMSVTAGDTNSPPIPAGEQLVVLRSQVVTNREPVFNKNPNHITVNPQGGTVMMTLLGWDQSVQAYKLYRQTNVVLGLKSLPGLELVTVTTPGELIETFPATDADKTREALSIIAR